MINDYLDDIVAYNPYEVGTIINENRVIRLATINKELALETYKAYVEKAKKSKDHYIVFLFDYNKNTNLEYYDSESEVS